MTPWLPGACFLCEPCTPSRPFDGPIGDTPRVQAWVLQAMKTPAAP